MPLNPNGNDPLFPKLPNGVRDVDFAWKLSDTWKQMEALVKKGETKMYFPLNAIPDSRYRGLGKVKSIGVSNFSQMKLEEILPTAEIVPAVNQASRLSSWCERVYCRLISLPARNSSIQSST